VVKLAALVLVALAAVAEASPPDPDEYVEEPEDDPAFNMLGFRMSFGALPLHGARTMSLSVGIGVEHPVFEKTRVFGEYEWLWLTTIDERAMDSVVIRPERHASGHRISLGLRREMLGKNLGSTVRVFVDGELGGALALANDNLSGVELIPAGFVGARFGYDMYSRSDDSPSRTFEAELLVRAIVVEGGVGALTGVGLAWGN
jgi:hypothetical protein